MGTGEDIIRSKGWPIYVEHILSIPLSLYGDQDFVAWIDNKKVALTCDQLTICME